MRRGERIVKAGAIDTRHFSKRILCPKCKGKGIVNTLVGEHPSLERDNILCPYCDGEGIIIQETDINYFKQEANAKSRANT